MFDNKIDPSYPKQPGEIASMEDLRKMIDGYDCGVRFADMNLGQLLEALAIQGVMDDVIIIVSADHGEIWGNSVSTRSMVRRIQATCRIPMIIRWPGKKAGMEDTGLHYHLDLGPTLAELLNKEPAASWDGNSYASVLTEGIPAGREYLVISQCAHVCQEVFALTTGSTHVRITMDSTCLTTKCCTT